MSDLREKDELKSVVEKLKSIEKEMLIQPKVSEPVVHIDSVDEPLYFSDITSALDEVKELGILDAETLTHLFHVQEALKFKEVELSQDQTKRKERLKELEKERDQLVLTIEQYFSFDSKLKDDYCFYSIVKKHFKESELKQIIDALIAVDILYVEEHKRIVFKTKSDRFADTKTALSGFLMSKGVEDAVLSSISAHTQSSLVDFSSRKSPLSIF